MAKQVKVTFTELSDKMKSQGFYKELSFEYVEGEPEILNPRVGLWNENWPTKGTPYTQMRTPDDTK